VRSVRLHASCRTVSELDGACRQEGPLTVALDALPR
jgi:hypothetical protein